ncbi:Basic leucine-zipper 5 [Dorcoceras hygrometricum]|uniref:Basic leucine-zipper 5 n=1 Tax=Dorcoceras hygrometricum TaxID=472368 RepID=A0A2Z7DH90_9LAMI|nr:Basic leucine-zipper 5 [Dorcoceras hygrometricum]
MLSSLPSLEDIFPVFEPGSVPWGSHDQEPPFVFDTKELLSSQGPASSDSGSYKRSRVQTTPDSASSERNLNTCKNSSSSSVIVIDERKHKRMISNRESARRSRMRKQKHLDNLRNQVNRLKVANRQTMNRLSLVVQQNQLVRRENEYLSSESAMLRQRLWDIRQVLLVRQLQQNLNPSAWPCNNFTSINGGQLPHHSLIT